MAILIDYNQVMLANLFASIGNHTNVEVDEDLIRHMFLSSLLRIRKKFNEEYGEIVLCADSKNVWRKEVYPYYKANRKRSRDESDLDWNQLFNVMHKIRDEVRDNFPYKVLWIEHCEADDIIATICHDHGTELNTGSEKYLIVSGDKDYIQLHIYANIAQYDPIRKRWIKNNDPNKYLQEHILRGDSGDGVPNVLSPDNCLALGERQKPMTSKRLNVLMEGTENMDEETLRRYHRNKMMIDLNEVPDKFKTIIRNEFNKEKDIGREGLFNYFVKNKLKNLMTDIQDF
jgi:5'-3' exonuclease